MANNIFNGVIQIIVAVGSLATFGAFIFLFRRDKDKQSQIDKLTGIATILEAQNETMKKQNDLIAQQVDIFRNTSLLKDVDNNALLELREIEVKKLKLSVKPNLYLNGAGTSGSEGKLHIDLNNKGETAIIHNLILTSEDLTLQSLSFPIELEKGQRRNIYGFSNGSKSINNCEYVIDIVYSDILENKYLAKINGKGAQVAITKTKEDETV